MPFKPHPDTSALLVQHAWGGPFGVVTTSNLPRHACPVHSIVAQVTDLAVGKPQNLTPFPELNLTSRIHPQQREADSRGIDRSVDAENNLARAPLITHFSLGHTLEVNLTPFSIFSNPLPTDSPHGYFRAADRSVTALVPYQ